MGNGSRDRHDDHIAPRRASDRCRGSRSVHGPVQGSLTAAGAIRFVRSARSAIVSFHRNGDGVGTEWGRSGDGVGTESGRSRDGVGTESGRSRDGVPGHVAPPRTVSPARTITRRRAPDHPLAGAQHPDRQTELRPTHLMRHPPEPPGRHRHGERRSRGVIRSPDPRRSAIAAVPHRVSHTAHRTPRTAHRAPRRGYSTARIRCEKSSRPDAAAARALIR